MKFPNLSSYEDWLALTDSEKHAAHRGWNVYDREGYGFPVCATGRLIISSQTKIFEVEVGIWHGGEYVLSAYVADEDYPKMPPPLEQTFEGFRVFWRPLSKHFGLKYKKPEA